MKWSVLDQSPLSAGSTQGADAERATIEKLRAAALVGTGAQVAEKLHALARRLELDEIVINTWTFDPQVRRHSYSLLAETFGLSGTAAKVP